MPEHYDARTLGRARALYDEVRTWAEERGDVTIIGGWAVYELVDPLLAMQSRDVDLVLHTEDALIDVLGRAQGWGLVWRTKGRKRFPDAHFKDEDPLAFRLDLFTAASNPTWKARFGRHGAANVKEDAPAQLIPPLGWLVADKLATVPMRRGLSDAPDKRAKDFIDVYHLVFHNTVGTQPRELVDDVSSEARGASLDFIGGAKSARPEYEDQLVTLSEWLRR